MNINIRELSFKDKVELLENLIDDLDIILDAAYGEEATISSENITIKDNKVRIWTGICTG